jgi:hypothetical protein
MEHPQTTTNLHPAHSFVLLLASLQLEESFGCSHHLNADKKKQTTKPSRTLTKESVSASRRPALMLHQEADPLWRIRARARMRNTIHGQVQTGAPVPVRIRDS